MTTTDKSTIESYRKHFIEAVPASDGTFRFRYQSVRAKSWSKLSLHSWPTAAQAIDWGRAAVELFIADQNGVCEECDELLDDDGNCSNCDFCGECGELWCDCDEFLDDEEDFE